MHGQGFVLAGIASGYCDGFEAEVEIESDEKHEVFTTLIRQAHQMSFTKQALIGHTQFKVTFQANGKSLEI